MQLQPGGGGRARAHVPSPLSLPPTTSTVVPAAPRSPLVLHSPPPASPVAARSLRQASSLLSLRHTHAQHAQHAQSAQVTSPAASPSATTVSFPTPPTPMPAQRRDSGSGQSVRSGKTSFPAREEDPYPQQSSRAPLPPSPLKAATFRQSHDSEHTHGSASVHRPEMVSPQPPSAAAFANGSPASSPLTRTGSLRTKMSLSSLKPKGTRSIREGPGASETAWGWGRRRMKRRCRLRIWSLSLCGLQRYNCPRRWRANMIAVQITGTRSPVRTDMHADSSSVFSEALSPSGSPA
ncbi:hypothetical protein K439DRAFT_1630624 [Ramaria rubella]|nr:hypothetical protein K439DRAFT_1630624 [Ramaria rubella]